MAKSFRPISPIQRSTQPANKEDRATYRTRGAEHNRNCYFHRINFHLRRKMNELHKYVFVSISQVQHCRKSSKCVATGIVCRQPICLKGWSVPRSLPTYPPPINTLFPLCLLLCCQILPNGNAIRKCIQCVTAYFSLMDNR